MVDPKIVVSDLVADRRGVTAMEYGVIAAAVIVAIATVLATVGTNLTAKFNAIASALK
jgi:pilus assembly protein Flp/PilA